MQVVRQCLVAQIMDEGEHADAATRGIFGHDLGHFGDPAAGQRAGVPGVGDPRSAGAVAGQDAGADQVFHALTHGHAAQPEAVGQRACPPNARAGQQALGANQGQDRILRLDVGWRPRYPAGGHGGVNSPGPSLGLLNPSLRIQVWHGDPVGFARPGVGCVRPDDQAAAFCSCITVRAARRARWAERRFAV
jgi:hypothetical protein